MTPPVSPSLRALLADSVDYAGLFPPAGLPLEQALENHSAYVRGDDAWMLGRFVLPGAKWSDTLPLIAGRFDARCPLRLSILGQKDISAEGFLESLRSGLQSVVNLCRAHREVLAVDQFESPLPLEPAPVLGVLLWQAAWLIETLLPDPVRAFWEVPFSEDLTETLRAFADHNAQIPPAERRQPVPRFQTDGRPLPSPPVSRTFRCPPFGLKLRTGGTEAAAFPLPGQLAAALLAARDAGVAVKFTAGLHHSVRHFNEGVGTHMHGFLNVFAAGILAREHSLGVEEIRAILEDERPESFHFDADGFAWRDRHVTTAAVAAHREFVTSFGSCSFDEPRDDLRRLGLLA